MKFLNKQSILIAIFTVTILGVPIGIVWPTGRIIIQTANDIYAEYEFLENKNKRGHDIKKVQAEYNALQDNLPLLTNQFLPTNSELDLITAIEVIADTYGVDSELQLDLKNVKPQTGYQELPFGLIARGTYQEVMQFLIALRTLPMTLSYDNIELNKVLLTRREEQEGIVDNQVQLRLHGFVFQEIAAETDNINMPLNRDHKQS